MRRRDHSRDADPSGFAIGERPGVGTRLPLFAGLPILGLPPVAGAFYHDNGGQAQANVLRLGRR